MTDRNTVFLVVDDFEVMRKVTTGQLRSFGADRILTAVNGADALRILRREPVHLVLSDLSMPIMSGFELLQAIRADHRLCRLPFIMITAEFDRQLIQQVIDAGVNDLLVKPYTTQRLATRIERALAQPAPPSRRVITPPPVPSPAPASPAPIRHTDPRPSVLVVDDTPDNLHMLSELFKNDYVVRVANHGARALSICLSDTPPDLVLLDIMMPGMDGFEVARQMREHPESENIPIIFVTAMTGHTAQFRGMSLGAVDFVNKPIDPEMLQLRVGNFMRYVALHKQLQSDYDGMMALSRLRDDVDQITRHDMRGPLAGALGLVQSMMADDGVGVRQADQLRLVEETVLQVLNLINLSAEIFRIETGRFQLQPRPVALSDILRRIVQMARVTYADKKLVLYADTDTQVGKESPQALGDALFCYSVFQNLVKNACEAAPPKSRVVISLSDTDPLRVLIKNSGTVPADIRDTFFDKFVTSHKSGGTGLGTYSARLLVLAQGGQITLDVSDEDNTTSLWVTLPRVCPE